MSKYPQEQHVRGTAEPLSPEETKARLRELAAWGMDLSLIEANLRRTPTERLRLMLQRREFIKALQQSHRRYLAASHRTSDTSDRGQERQQ